MFWLLFFTDTIPVDVNYPERNRKIAVIKCDELEGKNDKLHHGHFRFLEFDERFTDDDTIRRAQSG